MEGDWCEAQKRLLIQESDAWFDRHGLRLQRLRLPLPLPPNCNSWGDVAAEIEQHPLHLKLLNHQRLLAKRLKNNWSYSASARSTPNDPRNKHLPFKLQPLPRALAAELPQLSREMLHAEFDGLLLTVHSKELKPGGLSSKTPIRSAIGVSKVFAGCLIESLASNERQLRALWVNRRLSARSTRLLLQVLLPRAVVEAFALEAFTYSAAAMLQQQQPRQHLRVQSFKSVFIDRRDLDIWPRQCWMLLPALKNFGWPLHYDVKGRANAVHLDAGVSGSLTCSCHVTRTCLPPAEQATVDRFLMVTEPLLHLLLPLRSERSSLNIDKHPLFSQRRQPCTTSQNSKRKGGKGKIEKDVHDTHEVGERKGWREFISGQLDEELAREAACLVTGAPYCPRSGSASADDEWCGLTSEDVMLLVSDCEDVAEDTPRGVQAGTPTSGPHSHLTKPSPPNRNCRQTVRKQAEGKRSLSAANSADTKQTTSSLLTRSGTSPRASVGFPPISSTENPCAAVTPTGVRRSSRAVKRNRQHSP